jgi:hypothetical protein
MQSTSLDCRNRILHYSQLSVAKLDLWTHSTHSQWQKMDRYCCGRSERIGLAQKLPLVSWAPWAPWAPWSSLALSVSYHSVVYRVVRLIEVLWIGWWYVWKVLFVMRCVCVFDCCDWWCLLCLRCDCVCVFVCRGVYFCKSACEVHVNNASVCPSGLRGYVQVVMFSDSWVQIPQLTFCLTPQQILHSLPETHGTIYLCPI